MRKRVLGFTLIEFSVTLAVAGGLVAVAVPSFLRLMEETRTATATHLLTASMMSARAAAITRRHSVTMCPSSDGTRCREDSIWEHGWIVFDDPRHDGSPAGVESILHRVNGINGRLRVRGTAGRPKLRYLGSGSARGSNMSMHICSAEGLLIAKVVVNTMGRARTERSRPDTPCPVPV